MKFYQYQAVDTLGNRTQGREAAPDYPTLAAKLLKRDLYLVSATVGFESQIKTWLSSISALQLQELCFQLYLMLRAGINLIDALEAISLQKGSTRLSRILAQINCVLKQGYLLSDALSQFPQIFDRIFISLVRTGEQSGELAACFERLLRYLEWQHELRQKLGRALIYPLLLSSCMIGLISILMLVVIPQLQHLLESSQQVLPLATRLLMITAQIFKMSVFPVFCIVLGGSIMIMICRKISLPFRQLTDHLKLVLPGIGPLLLLVDTSRFVYTLHVLFTSGVPILESLAQSQQSIKNSWLQQRLHYVQLRIRQGELLSSAINNEGIFAGILTRLVAVGEQAGNLGQALHHADHFFTQTLKRRFEVMVTLVEPVLILFLGLILIWVAAAIFVPLYEHLGAVT